MFTKQTLTLKESNKTPQKVLEDIDREMKQWLGEHEDEDISREEKQQALEGIQRAYVGIGNTFGTVVEEKKQAFLHAAEEGKPFIFDEITAIIPELQIALNDIMNGTIKEGEDKTVYVPGNGYVTVKKGFVVIGTGNIGYAGVQKENPAFMNRVQEIPFEGITQDTETKLGDIPENYDKNELYILALLMIPREEHSIALDPNDTPTWNTLLKLVQFMTRMNDAFHKTSEGGGLEVGMGGAHGIIQAVRVDKPFTIRDLESIINMWWDHTDRTPEALEMEIWEQYISTIHDPEAKNAIYKVALVIGGLFNSENWYGVTDIEQGKIGPKEEYKQNYGEKQFEKRGEMLQRITDGEQKRTTKVDLLKKVFGEPPKDDGIDRESLNMQVEIDKMLQEGTKMLKRIDENIEAQCTNS